MINRSPLIFMRTLLIFGMLILLLIVCSSCTTKLGSIKGAVILGNDTGDPSHDPVDFSGVTVGIYEPTSLDTTLTRINGQYPQIGVQINQETVFDHRNANPYKITATGPDGSFAFGSVDPGLYNVVFIKEGWGIRYLLNIIVEEDQSLNLDSLRLFPSLAYSASVTENTTFKSDHTYILSGDVVFIDSVLVEPKAQIFINPGSAVRFYGNFETPESIVMTDAWRITSAKNLYSTSGYGIGADDYFGSVSFYGDSQTVANGVFNYFSYIGFIGDNCEIRNVSLSNCTSGIVSNGCDLEISNVTIAHGTGDGVNCQSSSDLSLKISDSIIMYMNHAVFYSALGTYAISNSYFWGSGTALRMQYGHGSISHNVFAENDLAISFYSVTTDVDISYNSFLSSGLYAIRPWFEAVVNNNNFYRVNGHYIIIWDSDLQNNSFVTADLDARNNYWAEANLDEFLLDANDNDEHPDEPCPYYIIYQPKSNLPVADAGIQ